MHSRTDVHEGIAGRLLSGRATTSVRVVRARPYSLAIEMVDTAPPETSASFESLLLCANGRTLDLGPCRFLPHGDRLTRRHDDPEPEPGDGRLVLTENVYDFINLFESGTVVDLHQKARQLTAIWQRREGVQPAFRAYTQDLHYDLQVYRAFFDDVDRQVANDNEEVRRVVQASVMRAEYPAFALFLDRELGVLEKLTHDFSRQEHELHGFYFRKQLWDIILTSQIMARTNLKPRGYAGDSVMMQMLYDREPRGMSIFAKLMHRHPIEHAAAQAVRNRREVVRRAIREHSEAARAAGRSRLRVLSIACGPAREITDLIVGPDDAQRYAFVLFDQDAAALSEAQAVVAACESRLGVPLDVRYVRGSVRTLSQALHEGGLAELDFVYSMGMFDYLTPPVARHVLFGLYAMLAPGGELLVGNFHPNNPSRIYMEYWLDWVLYYRDEAEFLGLAEGLPAKARRVFFEPAGAQIFLELRRSS